MHRSITLVLLALFCIAQAAQPPLIMAAAPSSDSSTGGTVVQFNPHNISDCVGQGNMSTWAIPIAGALDSAGHRYFLNTERGLRVLVFNTVTSEQLGTGINIPYIDAPPLSLDYDSLKDRLWMVYQSVSTNLTFCAMSTSTTSPTYQCYNFSTYTALLQSTVFDSETRTLWTFAVQGSNNVLLGFNVDSQQLTSTVMQGTCVFPVMVAVNGTISLTCYYNPTNAFVFVNTQSGQVQNLYAVPSGSSNPLMVTSQWTQDKQTSSLYFLYPNLYLSWIEVDVQSGKVLINQFAGDLSLVLMSSVFVSQ